MTGQIITKSGRDIIFAGCSESTNFAAVPSGPFTIFSIQSHTLGSEKTLSASNTLGLGGIMAAPDRNPEQLSGDVVKFLDLRELGAFLTMHLGEPASEVHGTTLYTHIWTDRGTANGLPSTCFAQEVPSPGAAAYLNFIGVVSKSVKFDISGSNEPLVTHSFLGRGELQPSSTVLGSAVTLGTTGALRLFRTESVTTFTASGITSLGVLESASLVYDNKVTEARDSTGLVVGFDRGQPEVTFDGKIRFTDPAIYNAAANLVIGDLKVVYTSVANAGMSLTLEIPSLQLSKSKIAVSGPGGITLDLKGMGIHNTTISPPCGFKVTLVNDISSHAW